MKYEWFSFLISIFLLEILSSEAKFRGIKRNEKKYCLKYFKGGSIDGSTTGPSAPDYSESHKITAPESTKSPEPESGEGFTSISKKGYLDHYEEETSPDTLSSKSTLDLRKLVQELEESDYEGYGSWGNFGKQQTSQNISKFHHRLAVERERERRYELAQQRARDEAYHRAKKKKDDEDTRLMEMQRRLEEEEAHRRELQERLQREMFREQQKFISQNHQIPNQRILEGYASRGVSVLERASLQPSLSPSQKNSPIQAQSGLQETNKQGSSAGMSLTAWEQQYGKMTETGTPNLVSSSDADQSEAWSTASQYTGNPLAPTVGNQHSTDASDMDLFGDISGIPASQQITSGPALYSQPLPPHLNARNGIPSLQAAQVTNSKLTAQPLQLGGHLLEEPDFSSALLSLGSCWRLAIITTIGIVLSYVAVVPYSSPQALYNTKVRENFMLLFLSLIGPMVLILLLYSSQCANPNTFIAVFHAGFISYPLVFVLELMLTTGFRLAVFYWLERDIFKLSPNVPAIFLPWVFSDHGYKLNRLTAWISEFVACCVGAPILEEVIKYKVMMWTKALRMWQPGDPYPVFPARSIANTPQVPMVASAAQSIPNQQLAPVQPWPNTYAFEKLGRVPTVPATVHTYMLYMIGAGIGLKTFDNFRRILMYNKPYQTHKAFFAAMRGLYPVHELCAALTAIRMARRDLLGEHIPTWRLFVPAALLHAFANFRGTRPIFKWKADHPWMDIQLQPPNTPDEAGLGRLVSRGLRTVIWASILLRVLGHIVKSYWRINKLHNRRVEAHKFAAVIQTQN